MGPAAHSVSAQARAAKPAAVSSQATMIRPILGVPRKGAIRSRSCAHLLSVAGWHSVPAEVVIDAGAGPGSSASAFAD
jgi:hypothetical protein